MLIVAPVCCFYFMEFMLRNPLEKMKFPLQLLNILFFELFTLLLFFALKTVRGAVSITAGLSAFIGLLTYFIVSFRGIPVQPWDLFSLKTAASVADNYEYRLTTKVFLLLLAFFALIILVQFLKAEFQMKLVVRMIGTLFCGICLVLATFYVQSPKAVKDFRIYDKLFTPLTMTYKDGTVVAFLLEAQYLSVDKPADYRKSNMEKLLAEYEEEKEETKHPNIIVIMNEAFSDLSILGDFTCNEDPMPFVRDLMENGDNTISGYLDVSVLGGNTANSEFEFLTGHSMAFLPQGCIPYQQYVKTEKENMASHLKELGYLNVAMHPYKATGWDRDKVYERFGFDTFYSQDDFENPELIRKYISDRENYKKIIEIFEEKEKDKPLFLFNVTMQNHSSYTDLYDNFQAEIKVEGVDHIGLEQYLSLIRESDKAIEELISYFDECGEDTIIVHFGDHQPTDSVVSPIYQLNGKNMSDLSEEELRLRYQVPYFIHANFDIEEIRGKRQSANFLGASTLEAAGISLSPYQTFLTELQKDFCSVSAMQTTNAAGETKSISDSREELLNYHSLQYYQLFDK